MQQPDARKILQDEVGRALAAGDDNSIRQALEQPGSPAGRAVLVDALEAGIEPAAEASTAIRVFALPLLMVTGGMEGALIRGVVPDVKALQELFSLHGALGQARNFGLGNALVSAQALAGLDLSLLYRLVREPGATEFRPVDLPPEDIETLTTEERAHLRFLVGASVTPRNAPAFAETAGNIGAWGMSFTRALASQLGQEGLSLLPIPRPPMSPLRALDAGRFAQRELGFQLFLSNALRKFRASVGEPDAVVATRADGSVNIALSSPFGDAPADAYAWPLYPGDEFAAVKRSIFDLLAECRVANVQVADAVQPVPASH